MLVALLLAFTQFFHKTIEENKISITSAFGGNVFMASVNEKNLNFQQKNTCTASLFTNRRGTKK